jgi:hypothetical protein
MNENNLPKYPELNRIALLYPSPQIMLGEEIYWTEKRDGSQLRIALVDGEVKVATHHQEEASGQFVEYFKQTEQANAITELLRDSNGLCANPTANFNIGSVVFGELLSKGRSPARFEHHDKFEFVIFDIWSQKDNRFLPYNSVYSYAYHYSLPVVESWAMTRHVDLESLYSYRDEMLVLARAKGREGVVLKNYHSQIFAKEKLDTPVIPRIKIEDGTPRLPNLPDSEVLGAIAKVHTDLGEAFLDKRVAMPTIAKYVSEEQEKHQCSKPTQNLFSYYQKYIEELKLSEVSK